MVPTRPTFIPEERPAQVLIQSRPRYQTTTPVYEEVRPVTPLPPRASSRPVLKNDPPTTYRPQLQYPQVAVTPRPALLYTPKQSTPFRSTHFPSSTPASVTTSPIDFAAEFQKFTSDNQLHSSTPSPVRTTKPGLHTNVQQSTSNPIYSSELIFDPNSGQYNTAVYQTLPQTEGDFTLRHRIQPYVATQQQPQLVSLSQLQKQSPLYRPQTSLPSQSAYQQTQQEIQFLNSQQLFAQQQKARQQSQQKTEPQQFYYIQPSLLQSQPGLATGQIDAFLRGHNIQF